MRIEMRVRGLGETLRALTAVCPKAAKRAVQQGVNEWTKLALGWAKANLKAAGAIRTKMLLKSLGRKVKVYRKGDVIYGMVGARRDSKGKPPKYQRYVGMRRKKSGKVVAKVIIPAKYIHLVELGTRHSRPRPFIRRAYYQTRGQARQMIQRRVQVALAALRRR